MWLILTADGFMLWNIPKSFTDNISINYNDFKYFTTFSIFDFSVPYVLLSILSKSHSFLCKSSINLFNSTIIFGYPVSVYFSV